jgi:hypothetical protein
MKINQRLSRSDIEEIGGGVRTAQTSAETLADQQEGQDDRDSNSEIDEIYLAPCPPVKRHHNPTRRLKARKIAEERLKQLSDELVELADELRDLNPLMADALDTAWVSADEALEILLDDHMW